MTKKTWVHKHRSFDSANEYDDAYYFRMNRRERIETMQLLREMFFKINRGNGVAHRKRLRRVFKVIKQI
jgi:hypothetical protein